MTWSRMTIRVGIDMIPKPAASSGWASVSTLAKTMSVWRWAACSNTGANHWHGPHQAAQKSIRTSSLPLVTWSKLSLVHRRHHDHPSERYPGGYNRIGAQSIPYTQPAVPNVTGGVAWGSSIDPRAVPARLYTDESPVCGRTNSTGPAPGQGARLPRMVSRAGGGSVAARRSP